MRPIHKHEFRLYVLIISSFLGLQRCGNILKVSSPQKAEDKRASDDVFFSLLWVGNLENEISLIGKSLINLFPITLL